MLITSLTPALRAALRSGRPPDTSTLNTYACLHAGLPGRGRPGSVADWCTTIYTTTMSGAQSESPNSPSQPTRGAAIDTDLYCLHCGYNLRGLSGDPVRCPECGNLNPIGDVEIPAPIIKKQLRRMETAPAVSMLGLLFLLPALGFLALVLCDQGPVYAETAACFGVQGTIGGIVWVVGIARFRSSCLGRPGWLAALLRYQLVASVFAGLVLVVFLFATYSMMEQGWRLNRYLGEEWPCIALPLLFAAVIAGIIWGLRPVHRWLKGPMEQLQREVAVKIARDRVRRELHHQRRWGKEI